MGGPTPATSQIVSAGLEQSLKDRKEHQLRALVVRFLRWADAGGLLGDPDGLLADVVLAACCCICFFVLTAVMRRATDLGKKANAAAARERWEETKEAERLMETKRKDAHRPNVYRKTGINTFGGILKANVEAKIKRQKEDALRPRTAWLGKTRFTRTPDPSRVELTRCRCWFGSECYRTSEKHKAGYCHPGDTDWWDRQVVLSLHATTEKHIEECSRGFTKAGGRGEFVPTDSAGVFLKAYSGLPACFLKKIGECVVGMDATVPKIRREQFAFAMRATDALQLIVADGDITVDDLVLDGVGGVVKSAEQAEKQRKKSSRGLPAGVRAELRSLSTAELRARVAREEELLKRDRALAFLDEDDVIRQRTKTGIRVNDGKPLFGAGAYNVRTHASTPRRYLFNY